MPITTTVTWADLIDAQRDELDDLREQYDEVTTLAREEYGPDALNQPIPGDLENVAAEKRALAVYQQQAAMYDEGAKVLQRRINLLERLRDDLGDGDFEIKMLSGEEAMNLEVDLRTDADDTDAQAVQLMRNQRTTDAAVVDAPAGFPEDDDGSPKPSDAPNALVNSLFDAVQRYNAAGDPDFRAAGFGGLGAAASAGSESSAVPNDSGTLSPPSATTDETRRGSGEE